MKKLIAGLFIASLTMSCGNTGEEAKARLAKAQSMYENNELFAAKNEIDSIRTLYPKEFDVLKQTLSLMRLVEIKENERTIAYCDSLLPIKTAELIAINKDFVFENEWYEVKTKSINKDYVHISNNMQLESSEPGLLIVVSCQKTSELSNSAYSLMRLHRSIIEEICSDELLEIYLEKLAHLHFIPDEFYEEPLFDIAKPKYYCVDSQFPKVKKEKDDKAIFNIKYDLYLPMLEKYIVEDISEWKNTEKV